MCIGVPMRIEGGDALTAIAITESGDGVSERRSLDMMLVGAQPAGTWVLAFCGTARRVLDPVEALKTRDALAALQIAIDSHQQPTHASEAIDALFADLVDRPPQLPEHLRSN